MTTTCTTWHVRIDLVGDAAGLSARAKLVGAPGAGACRDHPAQQPGCAACRDLRLYGTWQDLPAALGTLVEALQTAHLSLGRDERLTAPGVPQRR